MSANREFGWRACKRIDRFSHPEILAWQELNGIILEAWQLAAISLIDEAYVKAFNSTDTPKSNLVPVRKLTSKLFDAMFRK